MSHYDTARRLWSNVQASKPGQIISVTGKDLEISDVVAVAKGRCQPHLTEDQSTVERIHESVRQLADYLMKGNAVYGVTTGFGGSADSRTKEMNKLQVSLLQHTQSGVLLDADRAETNPPSTDSTEQNSYPIAWVRATMLVRCNATARGHSAVTMPVLQGILRLLRHDITPVVPLRGTVSASGDLMPLSYIAGAIEGNPDIWVRKCQEDKVQTMPAADALAQEAIPKTVFGPKEALGLVNGTAASAALASLVMYDAHHLAVLSQAITAIAVEGLLGNSESFHPFISITRPHPGQIETSKNILARLQGSSFARGIIGVKNYNPVGLVQDRYALRSTPQWIGPQLEDLLAAHTQVTTEINSSADNPLVDIEANEVYYGANFQAAAITAAMEKTRTALQMLGKLLFAQSSEMIDPNLNNGLPTNLAADDPSTSFTMKGVDVNMAAYTSELGFLANPVSSHVQTAEMHNQSINSLAFISARMTKKASELVSLMAATCLYVGCQAMDLRAFQLDFLSALQEAIEDVNSDKLSSHLSLEQRLRLNAELEIRVGRTWRATNRLDLSERIRSVGDDALLALLEIFQDGIPESACIPFPAALAWKQALEARATSTYKTTERAFFISPSTESYIGVGSLPLYRKIRGELSVPFHQGVVEHPGSEYGVLYGGVGERPRKTIGSWIGVIYQALIDGRIYDALYYDDAGQKTTNGHKSNGLNGYHGNLDQE